MRAASEVLEDLLVLLELTDLGARAAAGGRERWAISCARRAVSVNVEQLGPELPALREGLARAARFVVQRPDEDTHRDAVGLVEQAIRGVGERMQQTRNHRGANVRRSTLLAVRAHQAAEAVKLAVDCAATGRGHQGVAELARSSFPDQEPEASHQARRLLVCTKLLPSGPDLLVRLDYAESLGRLPIDGEPREWIESQRVLLMADDEAGRIAMVLRHLELVFLAELERVR